MKYQKGFTLIELLVVIAIIGVLAALVTASISDARAKSRAVAKKAQVAEILKAVRLYELDNPGNPPANTNGGSWAAASDALQPLVTGGYIKSIPESPDSEPYYYYRYTDYVMVATRLTPREYGPDPRGWHCSDAAGGVNDKIYCDGFNF